MPQQLQLLGDRVRQVVGAGQSYRHRIQCELAAIDGEIDIGDGQQSREFGHRECGLRHAAPTDDHHLSNGTVAQRFQGVGGDVGRGECVGVHGQDPGHVECDVAVADDDCAFV
ncbi:unannotated protein [freshwater metagenome]|uniref:Unannotated protein n=1 Tax=freshwater metagenome TaxID=449393 RepID=A0A6J7FPZ7_9ZZZZ